MNLQSFSIPFEMCWNIEQMNRLALSWGPCNQVEMFAAKDPDLRFAIRQLRVHINDAKREMIGFSISMEPQKSGCLIGTLTTVYCNSYITG